MPEWEPAPESVHGASLMATPAAELLQEVLCALLGTSGRLVRMTEAEAVTPRQTTAAPGLVYEFKFAEDAEEISG